MKGRGNKALNFGENLQSLISQQIVAVFGVILGLMAINYFLKKETGKMIGFIILAAICAVFVIDPTWVTNLLVTIVKAIFG